MQHLSCSAERAVHTLWVHKKELGASIQGGAERVPVPGRPPLWLSQFALICTLLLMLVFGICINESAGAGENWVVKVDPWVFSAEERGEVEFLIYLREQADLSGAAQLSTKRAKGAYVFEKLTAVASRTQAPLLAELTRRGVPHHSFWIANMIWARGDLGLIEILASRWDVTHIYGNPRVLLQMPHSEPVVFPFQETDGIEWNIALVRAPEVWGEGYTGQGIVIGGQDTGYDWEHPALKEHYRGWDGTTADHNYNWHDAIHDAPANPCGDDSPVPCDDHGHGTHTMGIMVGEDPAQVNRIGMAPGARWIGCRNMDEGFGTPASYAECYQWFVAPTDLNDENPDPTKAPHVINNSWSCPPYEGCTEPDILLAVVEAVRAAGILTVHAAGNSGPDCSTIDTPAAIYDASFTVGNTNRDDKINDSSSRGPVTIDGSGRLKPDVSAPGTSIRSSWTGGGYINLTGTSMAGPHVAGLAALLFSARPDLVGQVDQVEQLITSAAVPIPVAQTCGGIPGDRFPNPVVGWGRIDAWGAYQRQITRLFAPLVVLSNSQD